MGLLVFHQPVIGVQRGTQTAGGRLVEEDNNLGSRAILSVSPAYETGVSAGMSAGNSWVENSGQPALSGSEIAV